MQAHMSTMRTYCLDRLNIRFGKLLCPVFGMAYFITAELAFAANIALTGHGKILHTN